MSKEDRFTRPLSGSSKELAWWNNNNPGGMAGAKMLARPLISSCVLSTGSRYIAIAFGGHQQEIHRITLRSRATVKTPESSI